MNANLLRVADVAERLGLSPSKIYQLVAKRKIAHRRIGGVIRFEEADIREFLESSKHGRNAAETWSGRCNPQQPSRKPTPKTWF